MSNDPVTPQLIGGAVGATVGGKVDAAPGAPASGGAPAAGTNAQNIEMQPVRDVPDQPDVLDRPGVDSGIFDSGPELPSSVTSEAGEDLGERLITGVVAGAEDGAEAGSVAEPGLGTAIGAVTGVAIGAGVALVSDLLKGD